MKGNPWKSYKSSYPMDLAIRVKWKDDQWDENYWDRDPLKVADVREFFQSVFPEMKVFNDGFDIDLEKWEEDLIIITPYIKCKVGVLPGSDGDTWNPPEPTMVEVTLDKSCPKIWACYNERTDILGLVNKTEFLEFLQEKVSDKIVDIKSMELYCAIPAEDFDDYILDRLPTKEFDWD